MKKLLLMLLLLSAVSLFVGVADLPFMSLLMGEVRSLDLLIESRLPRLIAIWLAGGGLSVAGLIMQQISQNRFAAPSTSGTIECATLGYVLSLVIYGHGHNLWLIFGCAMLGTLLFVKFIHNLQFKNVIYVPLVGIIFGNVVGAAATFVAYKYDAVQNLSSWLVANFSSVLKGNYELLYIAFPVAIISYWYSRRLTAVGMGRDFSINIGLNYHHIVLIGVLLVSVMSATVVLIVGELPFLGLIVPNLVAKYLGDDLRKNLPYTAVCGAILVLICDLIGRVVIFPYEVPISMIISVVGGTLFLYLIIKEREDA